MQRSQHAFTSAVLYSLRPFATWKPHPGTISAHLRVCTKGQNWQTDLASVGVFMLGSRCCKTMSRRLVLRKMTLIAHLVSDSSPLKPGLSKIQHELLNLACHDLHSSQSMCVSQVPHHTHSSRVTVAWCSKLPSDSCENRCSRNVYYRLQSHTHCIDSLQPLLCSACCLIWDRIVSKSSSIASRHSQ